MKRVLLFAVLLGITSGIPALSQNRQADLSVRNDFKVDVVTNKIGSVVTDQIFVISTTIRNNGDVGASGIPVHFIVNGSVIAWHFIPALNSAMESQFSFSVRPTGAGRYEIRTTVDPGNNIAEASEENNSKVFTLNIDENHNVTLEEGGSSAIQLNMINQVTEPAPVTQTGDIDLDFSRDPFLSGSWPHLRKSGSVINLDVINRGTIAARNVEIAVYIDGTRQMIRAIGTIPAGESRHVHLDWKPQSLGAQRLIIVVDPRNRIEETWEYNNTISLDATVS